MNVPRTWRTEGRGQIREDTEAASPTIFSPSVSVSVPSAFYLLTHIPIKDIPRQDHPNEEAGLIPVSRLLIKHRKWVREIRPI